MSRTVSTDRIERLLTTGDVYEVWRIIDASASVAPVRGRRRSRQGRTLIVGRCVAGILMVTIVLTIGPLLRATGA
jgi:hypothetical protein